MTVKWDGKGVSPTLYSKTATGAINTWRCWTDKGDVVVAWGQLEGTYQIARFGCKPKNEGKKNATTAEQQAVKEAKAKWVNQIKKKYSTSLETAGETKRIKPMLALDVKKRTKPIQYPVLVQPKLDGVRCLAHRDDQGKIILQSRGGDPYPVEHIARELEPLLSHDIILDGELYIHGVSLQTLVSLAKKPQPGSIELFYCLYDVTNRTHSMGPYPQRSLYLRGFFEKSIGQRHKVVEVQTTWCACEVSTKSLCTYYEEEGYEGLIIRTREGLYKEDHRSPDLLKMKNWQDAEYPITGWYAGRGKFENAAVFTCVAANGKEFAVTPTGTAAERYEMLQLAPTLIGKLLKVKYLAFTDEGAPKCARAIAIREKDDL